MSRRCPLARFPLAANITPHKIPAKKTLMVPMGCCGFLWNPRGSFQANEILYLGTSGMGPCVGFFLFDIGTRVTLVSHFESTSLNDDEHNCYRVAVELTSMFLEQVNRYDPVSYFRCWIVFGSAPEDTSLEIAERFKFLYKVTARAAEGSELVNQEEGGITQAMSGTMVLDTRVGNLYSVTGSARQLEGDMRNVNNFQGWTTNNRDCGALLNLEVPLTATEDWPSRPYHQAG